MNIRRMAVCIIGGLVAAGVCIAGMKSGGNINLTTAVLISTIVTHADVHKQQMRQLDELVKVRGLREQLVLIAGGTQVTDKLARECGMDAGFGHGTTGRDVASFLMRTLRDMESE